MNKAAKELLDAQSTGLITQEEALQVLEGRNIQGAFRDDGSYIGYDYTNQEWLDTGLKARRAALEGKRNSVIFYGGWYSIDNASGRCRHTSTLQRAIELAEAANS